ncbi:MAG: hypothetical protein JWN24_2652 [Phycisphaerales bacterium]|nr:hypothetical protein [Phycisphaerales bacterium]
MVSSNVQRVFHEVKSLVQSLAPDERRQLREMIDLLPAGTPEEELERRLLEAGTIRQIPRPLSDTPGRDEFEPVRIEGEPISETIIRERR